MHTRKHTPARARPSLAHRAAHVCRYTGVLCSSCVPGQFVYSGTCATACAEIEPQGVTTALGIMAVVTVWYLINTQSSDALDLLLTYVALLLPSRGCSLRACFSL